VSDKEKQYDEQIAPKLLEAALLCRQLGMSIVAHVEWEPMESGTTRIISDDASFALRMALLAAEAKGNIDAFWMAIERHAKKVGHNSVFLAMRGIPETPSTAGGAEGARSER